MFECATLAANGNEETTPLKLEDLLEGDKNSPPQIRSVRLLVDSSLLQQAVPASGGDSTEEEEEPSTAGVTVAAKLTITETVDWATIYPNKTAVLAFTSGDALVVTEKGAKLYINKATSTYWERLLQNRFGGAFRHTGDKGVFFRDESKYCM